MVAGQIGQFIPMDEDIRAVSAVSEEDDGADRRYTKRGKTMSDVMTPEQRSRAKSHIKGKDTSIEVLLRKASGIKASAIGKTIKSCRSPRI